ILFQHKGRPVRTNGLAFFVRLISQPSRPPKPGIQVYADMILRLKDAQKNPSALEAREHANPEHDAGSRAPLALKSRRLQAQSPGRASKSRACGSLPGQRRRARSKKRLPGRWQVTIRLARTPCTSAPHRVLLQPPTLRVMTAGRSIRSAWLLVGGTSGSC